MYTKKKLSLFQRFLVQKSGPTKSDPLHQQMNPNKIHTKPPPVLHQVIRCFPKYPRDWEGTFDGERNKTLAPFEGGEFLGSSRGVSYTWWFKVTFLGLWKRDPFKGLSDLQLEDQKVTLNHLVVDVLWGFCLGYQKGGRGHGTGGSSGPAMRVRWTRRFFFHGQRTLRRFLTKRPSRKMTFCQMLCLGNMAKWVRLAVLKFWSSSAIYHGSLPWFLQVKQETLHVTLPRWNEK